MRFELTKECLPTTAKGVREHFCLKQKYSLIFFFTLGSDDEDRRSAYRPLIRESISEDELQVIRSYIQQRRALGSNPFHAAIEAPVGRCATMTP